MNSRLIQLCALLLLLVQGVLSVARGQPLCFCDAPESDHGQCDHDHSAPVSVDGQHDACETCVHVTAPDNSAQARQSAVSDLDLATPIECALVLFVFVPHPAPECPRLRIPPDPNEMADRCALRITRLLI